MISQDIIDRIIDEVNIAEVISEYLPILPDGTGFKAVCPFHHDTNPSMKISITKKIFKCFACGAGGNVIQFVAKYEKIGFQEAVIKLAKRIGIELQENHDPDYEEKKKLYAILNESNEFYRFYLQNSEEGQTALEYLAKRGITKELIEQFEIGLAPAEKDYLHQALDQKEFGLIDQIESGMIKKTSDNSVIDAFRGRIMFPLKDVKGHVVGFSGRVYLPDDHGPKYMNSNENLIFHKSEVLYNFSNAQDIARQSDELFVFEGFMDVIAAARAGINNAVATMGTALTKQHLKELNALTNHVVLCFDGDSAGINATYKAADVYASSGVIPFAVALPDELDPDEYQLKYGSEALNKYLHDNQMNVYDYLYNVAKKDLIVEDVVSVQRFKNKVFDFLRLANNTIKEFYLAKLAKELDIDISILYSDLGNSNRPNVVPTEEIVEVKKAPIKKTIPVKVYKALEIIIKHSLYSVESFKEFFCNFKNGLPYLDFADYFNIIEAIAEIYAKNETLDIDELFNRFFEDSSEVQLLQNIINSNCYTMEDSQEFKDCLKTIDSYETKLYLSAKYNSALEDDKLVNEYMDLLRQNITILKA